jgi:hypothetical protein
VWCEALNGLGRLKELPFWRDSGMWWLFAGLDFVGLEGTWGRLNGGGDDAGYPLGREKLADGKPEDSGRARTGDELPFAPPL